MAPVKERLRLIGIDCPSCIYSINKELARLRCVEEFDIDPSTGEGVIVYNSSRCRLNDIYKAIRDAGYDVFKDVVAYSIRELDVDITRAVEKKLSSLHGVFEFGVSIPTSTIRVVYNPYTLSSTDIEKIFTDLGIRFKRISEEVVKRSGGIEEAFLLRRIIAFSIGLLVVSTAMVSMFIKTSVVENPIYLAIASSVVIVLSYDIIYRGLRALVRLSPIMDSLIALSSLTSYVFGLASLSNIFSIHNGLHVSSFFEASAGILSFVGIGLYLEERVRRRAWGSVEDLLRRIFGKARVIINGNAVEVEADKVPLEAVVEVKAGEIIPVDGVVIDGEGYVDESSFTGEPTPVPRRAISRDPVLAGSILVSGYLRVRATRVGRETLLYKIVESIQEAQFYKPRILRIADRLVGFFTWGIIVLGIATFLYWSIFVNDLPKAILFVAAIFATACPCAIGIAIPIAVSIAITVASRRGIVIRRGDVFDRLSEVTTAIFDKTGTLTVGTPQVEKLIILSSGVDEDKLLTYLCSVESRSEHPISKAITSYCKERGIEFKQVDEFNGFPGLGVVGKIDGVSVVVGNIELLDRMGIDVGNDLEELVKSVGAHGRTPIIVAIDNKPVALIEIADKLRPETIDVVKQLKNMGLEVGIASGDTLENVRDYANQLGMDFYFYKLKPSDKVELVKKLQTEGKKVLYVGDGVNDAAAISIAHVGIAMGGGVDISKEAGDIVLTSDKLSDIIFIFKLSEKVRRKFIENLAWAFIYNATLLPIAAGAFYSYGIFLKPEFGAVAMILSDISVVLNSLRLLKMKN